MKPVLEINNISKEYRINQGAQAYLSLRDSVTSFFTGKKIAKNQFWALRDVQFNILPGESIGVIGRNGSGKSTLLKILSKITFPSKGYIRARGRVASLLEVGTGFHMELTGRENIFLNGAILGLTKKEIVERFDDIVAFSGVEAFLDTPLKHYSNGMALRLAFAVAAHLDPEILLIDEVLAVGDEAFQKKCIGKMDEVSKSGKTILFVSHNMNAVQQLCKRTIVLDQGQVKFDGPTKEAIQFYLENSNSWQSDNLQDRKDRKGGKKFKFTKIACFGDDISKAVRVFRSGQNIRVQLHYTHQFTEKVPITLALDFQKSGNQHLMSCRNAVVGQQLFLDPNKNAYFECHIPRLPLTPGRYYFNLTAYFNEKIIDRIHDVGYIDVSFGDYYGSGTLPPRYAGVCIDYQWK